MPPAIRIENVSKLYRLGTVGTGTISHDLNRWWHRIRGKEDPYAQVGQVNDRTEKSSASGRQSSATAVPANGQPRMSDSPDYVWALRDINLEVEQGEILGIIGRNGAGKSTLLKILSRVTAPTTGEIRTRGRIASLLEVGTGMHPELTGRENIYLNGAILGMKRQEIARRLDEIVEFSGCAKYLDTPVKRYSSGMTVRLGFAVAAHLECETLIVDEVLAVGDIAFQTRCIGKMKSIASGGRTVLFVTHNLVSIRRLCTTGVLIDKGTIEQRGDVATIVDAYSQKPQEDLNCSGLPDISNGVEVTEIRLGDESGRPKHNIQTWAPCTFTVTIRSETEVRNASLMLAISSAAGEREFTLLSHVMSNDELVLNSGINTVMFQLKAIPLSGGTHNVAVMVSEVRKSILYRHDTYRQLTVLGADVYDTGFALETATTPIVVDATVVRQ